MTPRELWRRGQEGWPRRYPLVQLPNAPLLLALGGGALARSPRETARRAGEAVRVLGMLCWAAGELARGANAWRRLLGAGTLAALARGALGARSRSALRGRAGR
jgi:hypothetical protein